VGGQEGRTDNQDFRGVSRDNGDEAANRLNARENLPAGLIAHVLTEIPGVYEPPTSGRARLIFRRSPRND
jgi:hypothetical protein